MKLTPQEKLPPAHLRLMVPGTVMQKLERYRTYQAETAGVEWETKELATEILRAFLTEGDRGFVVWLKHAGNGAGRPAAPAPAGNRQGGTQDDHPSDRSAPLTKEQL